MPWKAITPMDDRLQFIAAYQSEELSLAALCRAFGISRKTGYKWLARYETEGVAGLAEHSRPPTPIPRRSVPR